MTQNEKAALLAELFEVEEEQINADTQLADLNWDSMAMLGLIALFKSEFDQKLEPAKLRTLKSVGDILAMMP